MVDHLTDTGQAEAGRLAHRRPLPAGFALLAAGSYGAVTVCE